MPTDGDATEPTPDAPVGPDGAAGADAVVERHVDLDAPAEEVWAALTDDGALSAWFGGAVTLDPSPGGEGRFEEPDGTVRRARVDEAEPGRRLALRWWPEDDDDGTISTVAFELVPQPGGTRLVVVERPLLLGAARASATAWAGDRGLAWARLLLVAPARLAGRSGVPVAA